MSLQAALLLMPVWGLSLTVETAGRRVEVREDGAVVASFAPRTPAAKRGTPSVRQVEAAGHPVVEVRLPVAGAAGQEEVWLAEREGRDRRARPLWTGVVGPLDGDGETARRLLVGADGIELFQTAARLTRCDGAPAKLFAQSWDFEHRRFRASPPALPPAAQALAARSGDPEMPTGRAMSGFFWTGASSAAGVSDARALTAPAALNDGDPETTWAGGAGEFVTARASADAVGVVGMRVTLAGPRSARRTARPRRLVLLLGPSPEKRFDVELPADGAGALWVPLPKPVVSSCVTVMIREAAPAGRSAAIADLEVITEIDGPGGVNRLVEAVRAGGDCEARVPLLVGLGAGALGPVAAALARGPAPGRECLLTALDRLSARRDPAAENALAPALVAALDGATRDEEKLVLAMLPRLSAAPVAALAQRLGDDKRPDADRLRAARALAACDRSEEAKGALLAALGGGSPAVRSGVRELLASARPPLAAAVRHALGDATGVRRADLLFVLGPAAAREPEERAPALELLRAASGDFEGTARALGALGQLAALGDAAAVTELGRVRGQSGDPVLRYLAARELAAAPPALSLPPLRAALDDADPRVRETAAVALGRRRDAPSAPRLVAAARRERWPFVRRAEVSALGELCAPGSGDLFVHSLERDAPDVRRVALTGLAHCRDPRASALLQRTLGRRAEDPEMRALAARLLRDLGDRAAARPMAEALGRMRVEAEADMAIEGVAGVVMQALAGLGGPDAVAAAVSLLADGRPVLRRAAADALGTMCDGNAGARALAAAVSDKDPAVAASARSAQRRCQQRR